MSHAAVRAGRFTFASVVLMVVLAPSLAAQRTLEVARVPAAPTDVVVANGRYGVTVAWKGVESEALYRILRSADGKTPGVDLTAPIAATSYVDKGAEPGAAYFYQVIAVYADRSQGVATPVFYTPARNADQAIAAGAQLVTISSLFMSAQPAMQAITEIAPQQATAILPGLPVRDLKARPGSGGGVYITWEKATGASFYEGERWKQASPDCCRALVRDPNIPDQGSSFTDVPATSFAHWSDWLPTGGVFVYRVTVVYADGSRGSADVTYTQPGPSNPTWMMASQPWNNAVHLFWPPVTGAAYYVLWGPGAPNGIRLDVTWWSRRNAWGIQEWYAQHPQLASLSGIPNGVHSWGIRAYFQPGDQTTPPADFTRASLEVKTLP